MSTTRQPGPLGLGRPPSCLEGDPLWRARSAVPGPAGYTPDPMNVGPRLQSLRAACEHAEGLVPAAVAHRTGCTLGALLDALLPSLLQLFAVLAAGTLLGAGTGAVLGAFGGAVFGMEIGTVALTWLGVGFLAVSFGNHGGELAALIKLGVERAWAAGPLRSPQRELTIHAAARDLADAVAVVMLMLLEGLVAYLLKSPALASTRGAVSTATALRSGGAQPVAEETVANLVSGLRASKLGTGFASWVEQNWRALIDNPKLNPSAAARAINTPPPLGPGRDAGYTQASGGRGKKNGGGRGCKENS